ncbi:threonine synthase [Algoriphagus aestuariicola]|uniref:Threonine synthase n=1 Tax=Algoriphagus aestuariicola TaxID=1852016 RepID=A0ABS3BUV5_9BACT|nr:threonine synthase [Algoriphagus aestuariicola]MBN7802867.1 threonine synthase [Algoriphagus aestuariicola]
MTTLPLSQLSLLRKLQCPSCGKNYSPRLLQTFATCCNQPLVAEYALASEPLVVEDTGSMWRYAHYLPLFDVKNRVTLGEGLTPIVEWPTLANRYGLRHLLIKDESGNPTGSFKARGLSMAVSKALELGIEELVIPTAGNAGGALSAYARAAGLHATVIMPKDTPEHFKETCEKYGANLIQVSGMINACGRIASEIQAKRGAFNLATMKEPYRLEGKKTMGYEIFEQLTDQLPDVILYPTGGGTGLIGIWKAFQELAQMGLLSPEKFPRMVAVQAEGCAPIADRIRGVQSSPEDYTMSIAYGLSVPQAFAADLIVRVIRESDGEVVTVSDREIIKGINEIGLSENLSICPEGAAVWEGLKKLISENKIQPSERVLLLNTGAGYPM